MGGPTPGVWSPVFARLGLAGVARSEGKMAMAEQRHHRDFRLDPDRVRGFAKVVYDVSDTLAALRIRDVFLSGASACDGTVLNSGLVAHAGTQNDEMHLLTGDLDGFGDAVLGAIDAFERQDAGDAPRPSAH